MARILVRFVIVIGVACVSGAALVQHGAGLAHRATATAGLDPGSSSSDQFFQPAHVHTFELTLSAADFARMPPLDGRGGRGMGGWDGAPAADGPGYPKVSATLRFDGQSWGRIAVRYKGNSSYRGSRTELKRSLKLDFNVDGQHRRFFGMTKLNLNNNAFDSSQMRETLAYDIFRSEGVPAPRTTYARVYITVPGRYEREYAGLFTVVEEIDQRFFVERWDHKIGVLLKPEGLSGLPDLGSDWKNYAAPYSAKMPTRARDAARFIAFVRFVNHSSDAEFARRLPDYMDVDEFLHFLATEVVIVNSDSPLAMNHNYYLTIRPDTDKIVWVPWDMNMAFGGFHHSEQTLSLWHPSAPGMFPLADRVLFNPQWLARYREIVTTMISTSASRAYLDEQVRRLADAIRSSVVLDPSTGAEQFEANLSNEPPAATHVDNPQQPDFGGFAFRDRDGPPLRRFIDGRIESVRGQLDGTSTGVPGRAGFGFGP